MMVVTELEEPFLPLPDDMLVNLRESREVVDALLDSLPANWPNANLQLPDSATGPALQARAQRIWDATAVQQSARQQAFVPLFSRTCFIQPLTLPHTHTHPGSPTPTPHPSPQAAFLVMSHLGGKMLLFQGGVPSLGAGKFKARETLAAYGTDKEAGLRNPEDPFFKRWAGGRNGCRGVQGWQAGGCGGGWGAVRRTRPRCACARPSKLGPWRPHHQSRRGARSRVPPLRPRPLPAPPQLRRRGQPAADHARRVCRRARPRRPRVARRHPALHLRPGAGAATPAAPQPAALLLAQPATNQDARAALTARCSHPCFSSSPPPPPHPHPPPHPTPHPPTHPRGAPAPPPHP
jgi:hypothetical protein